LCQSGGALRGALRSKGKGNREEKIRKAEENYATPLMNVTVDKMEANRERSKPKKKTNRRRN